ncbi:hypothetical protein [Aeromonas rivipollensis]|uniref:Phage protein, HK97 gp10 family n=1 Tax=Aeromonas rivipollensis TaxID=948519 RepID=A0AAW9YB71_9GAMM|nr:hypothetical protein [Aeromonas rivipollensis]NEX74800.1 hypothetical protein [Aeromonas rivipollensis]
MAKNTNVQGLKELNDLLDSLTDPKFRKAALRATAKRVMTPVKSTMIENAPSEIKNDVVIKTKVNTNNKKLGNIKGFIKEDKFNELYSEVTFSYKKGTHGDESAYGMAMIYNYGRRNPLAKVSGDSKFHVFGNPTNEHLRYIGKTPGTYFVDKVRFEAEPKIRSDFEKYFLEEVEKQIKKHDRWIKKGGK